MGREVYELLRVLRAIDDHQSAEVVTVAHRSLIDDANRCIIAWLTLLRRIRDFRSVRKGRCRRRL
jgi:hypothetical protein